MEAAIVGIPAIAVSQWFHQRQMDFTPVKAYGHDVLAGDQTARTVLNINFPEGILPGKGIRQAVWMNINFQMKFCRGTHRTATGSGL